MTRAELTKHNRNIVRSYYDPSIEAQCAQIRRELVEQGCTPEDADAQIAFARPMLSQGRDIALAHADAAALLGNRITDIVHAETGELKITTRRQQVQRP